MNKDLDERLVPNGEYRDALNIQVSTSDGSNVSSVQNILSNKLILPTFATSFPNGNVQCVGAIADEAGNRFFWFLHGLNSLDPDMIVEYSAETESARAILIDVNKNVLKFTPNIITAINYFDGLLFWTDNYSEPKKINVENCVLGTPDYTTHTKLHNPIIDTVLGPNAPYTDSSVDLQEKHITVIKRSPKKAPTVELVPFENLNQPGVIDSKRFSDGTVLWGPDSYPGSTSTNTNGDPDINIAIRNSSATTNYTIVPGQTIINLKSVSINNIGFDSNSDGIVDSLKDNFNQQYSYNLDYDIRLRITSVSPYPPDPGAQSIEVDGTNALSGLIDVHCEIISISPGTTLNTSAWVVMFESTSEPLFELKMPRFSLRYKYIDGEYSSFGPFSQVAFQPNVYSFDSVNGFNLGMKNHLSAVKIQEFVLEELSGTGGVEHDAISHDVVGIDILYKESNSPSVYVIASVSPKSPEWYVPGITYGNGEYVITSEVINKILPENQLLRTFDNVPKKALSQEIIANRLVYGNYEQNINIEDGLLTGYTANVDVDFSYAKLNTATPPFNDFHNEVGYPSVKTLRTYQLGVVLEDFYGRQTPVLTHNNLSLNIPIQESASPVRFQAKVNTTLSDEIYGYKFFIKETSTEYYNLALSRWYNALDGNVWLSFNSSGRNKVDEEDYLYLKKSHGSDKHVHNANKYKILAIENEAPDYIKTTRDSLGTLTHTATNPVFPDPTFLPIENRNEFRLDSARVDSSGFSDIDERSNLEMVLKDTAGVNRSEKYKITNAILDPLNNVQYIIQIDDKFRSDVNFIEASNSTPSVPVIDDNIQIEITEAKIENKPEFDGKFFVKVSRDFNLNNFVVNESNDADDLVIVHQQPLFAFDQDDFETRNEEFSIDGGNDFDLDNAGPAANITVVDAVQRAKDIFEDPVWFIDSLNHEGSPSKVSASPNYWNWYNQFTTPQASPGNSFGDNQSSIDISFAGIEVTGDVGGYNSSNTNVHDNLWWVIGDSSNSKTAAQRDMASRLVPGSKFYYASDPDKKIFTITNVEITKLYNFADGIYSTVPTSDPSKLASDGYFKPWNRRIRYRIFLDDTNASTNVGSPSKTATTLLNFVEIGQDKYGSTSTSRNPAVFETKPKKDNALEIYHEASNVIKSNRQGQTHNIHWSNCFVFGNGVESNRIQDDFNAPFIDNGPKVSAVYEGEYKVERVSNRLIFSGIYNSTSSVNRTNEFITAENITKDLNPIYGGIQKLYARDTDLIALCEDKVFKILASKDALFNADGNVNLTATNRVLGQAIPFSGDYGISNNPESFAAEAYRSYFTDKQRGVVLRLSKDGLTPISEYGMKDYFSDELKNQQILLGTYDAKKDNYNLTMKPLPGTPGITVSYNENVRGWTSFKSFIPEIGVSLNSNYYTFDKADPWLHHAGPDYGSFYGQKGGAASVTAVLNQASGSVKTFKTLNYEGTQSQVEQEITDSSSGYYNLQPVVGWYTEHIHTDLEKGSVNEFIKKEGKWFNYIKGNPNQILLNQMSFQGLGTAIVTGAPPTLFTLTVQDTGDTD